MKKFTIKFYLRQRSRNAKTGKYKLYCRISYAGKQSEFALPYKLGEEEFDTVREMHKEDDEINEELEFIRYRLREIKRELFYRKKAVSPYLIRRIFEGKATVDGIISEVKLVDYMQRFLDDMYKSPQHEKSTWRNYKVKFEGIKQFMGKNKLTEIEIGLVDESFVQKLDNYLLGYTSKLYGKPLYRSSMNDFHKRLRALLNKAKKEKLLKENPYNYWTMPKDTRSKRIKYLTESELDKIIMKDLSELPRLERIKDMFLFSCFTGLRFSDIQRLRAEQIRRGEIGHYIDMEQKKTKQQVLIPLLTPAMELYQKYMAKGYHEVTGRIFPPISNQRFNAYLKELATVCGIKKELTHHMARHTCGTLLLSNGVSIGVVSQILGHSSLRTTEAYAKITKDSVWRNMRSFNRKKFGEDGQSDGDGQ